MAGSKGAPTSAQARMLRTLVQPAPVDSITGMERRSVEKLITLGYAYLAHGRYRISKAGSQWLDHHSPYTRGEVDRRERVTTTTLREEYGFSTRDINELLPPPMLEPNPHVRDGEPMRRWYRDEAEVASYTRRADMKRDEPAPTKAKRQAVGRRVDDAIRRIHVDRVSRRFLEQLVRDYYEDSCLEENKPADDLGGIAPAVLDRWRVNAIRHRLATYDESLWTLSGQPGAEENYRRYKAAVLDEIARMYPFLAHACEEQKTRLAER